MYGGVLMCFLLTLDIGGHIKDLFKGMQISLPYFPFIYEHCRSKDFLHHRPIQNHIVCVTFKMIRIKLGDFYGMLISDWLLV